MNNKTIPALTLICLFLFSCSLTPNIKASGTANLQKKQEYLVIGKTNKNDTINYLGETILKDPPDNNGWTYFETEVLKNVFGVTTVIKNNVLFLDFDNKGILVKKFILTASDLKKLQLDDTVTNSLAINDSFSKKFFSSMKKRFQNRMQQ